MKIVLYFFFLPIPLHLQPALMSTFTAGPVQQPQQQQTTASSLFKSSKFIGTIFFVLLIIAFLIWFRWHRSEAGELPGLDRLINSLSPYEWAGFGVAAALGLSVVGAGWYETSQFDFILIQF